MNILTFQLPFHNSRIMIVLTVYIRGRSLIKLPKDIINAANNKLTIPTLQKHPLKWKRCRFKYFTRQVTLKETIKLKWNFSNVKSSVCWNSYKEVVVFEWHEGFKEEREDMKYDGRLKLPKTHRTWQNVVKVQLLQKSWI